ncbi:MAG: hypothetical protein DRG30_10200 [Epsilonproteobacteria bacterium]|nr:MAG: hypothetical protein DRG30_10200 [Campylobacterota bacterium]
MRPLPHQLEFADRLWDILSVKGYAYLAGLPRSGKTLTAILTAEKSKKIHSVLVLTKKAAISGWHKFTEDEELELAHSYHITNYEQAHKLKPADYDLVIIDESHNLGTLAKPSKRIVTIKKLCYNMPHIHLSGTAIVESPCGIYHQMFISKYTPFPFKNFYDFFRRYGKPYYIKAAGRDIQQYDKALDTLMPVINEFTLYMTQEHAGISKSVQATDKIHYVELDSDTKELYNRLQKDQIASIEEGMFSNIPAAYKHIGSIEAYDLVCDTVMKLRTSLHMLEAGVAKVEDEYLMLGNTEKIDYIKKTFGDTKDTGIMSHFVGERMLLEKHFKNAQLFSSSADAEGVDLSHLKNFVILSSDYSGSKFVQRRDRIVNINGSSTTVVNHILVKKAISEAIYLSVSKKLDFNNWTYLKSKRSI